MEKSEKGQMRVMRRALKAAGFTVSFSDLGENQFPATGSFAVFRNDVPVDPKDVRLGDKVAIK